MKAHWGMLGVIALALSHGCGDGSSSPPPAETAPPEGLLFALTSEHDTWRHQGDDRYLLSLLEPSNVTAFTDRPDRAAYTLSPEELVDRWEDYGFGSDAPNAALVLDDDPEERNVAVLELGPPTYNGLELEYTVTLLRDFKGSVASYSPQGEPPPDFGTASLFIDGSSGEILPLKFTFTTHADKYGFISMRAQYGAFFEGAPRFDPAEDVHVSVSEDGTALFFGAWHKGEPRTYEVELQVRIPTPTGPDENLVALLVERLDDLDAFAQLENGESTRLYEESGVNVVRGD
jgi:hypothetical protein